MIYNFSKISEPTPSSQEGVTLLLSILVLSGIVAISFSFASIILVEIRSSGDVARTEPAYYAVQGVVEEAIFKIKRTVPDTLERENDFFFGTCAADLPVEAGATVATQNLISLTAGICNRDPDADVKDLVPPTAGGIPANTNNIYNLYDPSNPYTNTYTIAGSYPGCAGGNQCPSAYSMIEFDYLATPGANSIIHFCEADKDCFADGWTDIKTLSPGNNRIIYDATSTPPLLPSKAYQIYVVNTSTSLTGGIQIKSWGPDPVNNPGNPYQVVPKGLPAFGQFSVNVTASSLGLTRKYQVNIPSQ